MELTKSFDLGIKYTGHMCSADCPYYRPADGAPWGDGTPEFCFHPDHECSELGYEIEDDMPSRTDWCQEYYTEPKEYPFTINVDGEHCSGCEHHVCKEGDYYCHNEALFATMEVDENGVYQADGMEDFVLNGNLRSNWCMNTYDVGQMGYRLCGECENWVEESELRDSVGDYCPCLRCRNG